MKGKLIRAGKSLVYGGGTTTQDVKTSKEKSLKKSAGADSRHDANGDRRRNITPQAGRI